MKKIIIFTLCIIFIPFFIVLIYKLYFLKEIELNYIESRNIRGLVRKLNDYIVFLKENKEFETTFFELGDGVSISKKVKK